MQVTDTIADLLTRIRNAQAAKHDTVEVPASNMKKAICQILVDEGYVKNFTVTDDGKQGIINITLKYGAGRTPVIKGLKRVSKPGLRIYSNAQELPKVMKGLGIAVVSTSKGIMTDREAKNWKKTYKYSRRRRREGRRQRRDGEGPEGNPDPVFQPQDDCGG